MTQFRNACLTSLLGFFAACQPSSGEEIGTLSQPIVNGVESDSDDAVVALTYRGKQFCTGTLVGKRTIVTAAHCLPPNADVPLFGIEIVFGSDVSADATKLSVVDGIAHPEWSEDSVGNDIGLLALGEDAPVDPMVMAYYNVSALPEMLVQARAVGYGLTEANGSSNGRKHTGMLSIDYYDETSIYLDSGPASTCNGDSGGALIYLRDGKEVLGGIHSRSDCGSSIIAERIDIHTMNFVTPFMEEHEGSASCGKDGMCGTDCAEPDPDCLCVQDGICSDACEYLESDLDCTADCIGNECVVDAECKDGSCGDSTQPGGCSTGGGSAPWGALAFLAIVVAYRRRRA